MKNNHSRLRGICCAVAAILLCGVLAGCSDSGSSSAESSTEDVAMEDMEYGATLRDDDTRAVPLEYDKRYLEDGELDALANYYGAIQNEDVDLFQTCIVREYMESLYENAYGGLLDDAAYVAQQNSDYEEEMGAGFTFLRIAVTDCIDQSETGSNAEYLTEMLDELNEDSNYCTEHLESCKTLTIQPTLTDGTNTITCSEKTVFLVQIDGTYYVCA